MLFVIVHDEFYSFQNVKLPSTVVVIFLFIETFGKIIFAIDFFVSK